ncbi:carbohydrate-binding module family 18 protein [Chaetomium strumarium]|uniref:Carbohydrate-binding module family 18 protein n=1 Tax=Chaetomium strumarium TaxID=1170767 RepID=A0AAJ0GWB6_9PEZI|nr:carbohydrate-binding module family 18 protein [Chaetomium strumarium]
MVNLSRAGNLLLLALTFSHHAAAVCTRSVIAKQGDTCATLAAQAGITVTQFLRSNPAVTSCSQLVAGASYCVEGTNDSAPTPSSTGSAPPTSTSPSVSTDGTCGDGVTCAGSRFGNCCSAHGFCGSTDDYCGDGCQPGFGTCGSGGGITSPPASTTVTVTVTSITAITRTSLVYQTSTITNVVTRTQTAATTTVTRTTIETSQVTDVVSRTVTATVTATTATAIVTRTSTTTSTSLRTSIVTRTSTTTSTSIDRITTIITSTHVITSACPTAPTKTIIPITTTSTATRTQPGAPSPTLPGTPRNCKRYDMIQADDTCRSIANRNDLSLLDFYDLNPSVSDSLLTLCTGDILEAILSGLCQISCDALWEGYYVCIGR